MNTAIFNRK